ncbi:ABC transporter ATP-binding protein [Pseudorhodoplanes sp.]|uniref:ABC transporter ATP-binding protein n=1 Tax=Pseudorhodoplanes sp. TaxID=1934341 RepID=UPI003D10F474
MTEDRLLEVRNLSVWYHTDRGPLEALDAVSCSLGVGEVLGLVGESGCGKTTLGRALLGILPSNSDLRGGEIIFRGEDLLKQKPTEVRQSVRGRAITLVPQDPFASFDPLFRVASQLDDLMQWKSPRRKGGRNPWFPLFAWYDRARRREDRAAVMKMLTDIQLPDAESAVQKLPGQLSGGQCQRLLIAMALLPEPQMIIADEPTTALDVTIQGQILKLLFQVVRERSLSMIFTTHDLGVASEICDRIMVMYAGQEMETAPTETFFTQPRHPYTAKLLESLPARGGALKDIPGELPPLVNPPAGCRFQTRCERATPKCCTTRPPPLTVGDRHSVHCHHPLGGGFS